MTPQGARVTAGPADGSRCSSAVPAAGCRFGAAVPAAGCRCGAAVPAAGFSRDATFPAVDEVGHQHRLAAAPGPRHHRAGLDRPVLGQGGLDLRHLDPDAADLDLGVEPALEFDVAVGQAAPPVAGAVEARAGRAGERPRHEAARGLGGPSEVATGETRTAEADLAGDAGRHLPELAVQEVKLGAGQRPADRRRPIGERRTPRPGVIFEGRRIDRCLGNAVAVDRPRPPPGEPPEGRQVAPAHDIGADDREAQVVQRPRAAGARPVADQVTGDGRHQIEALDPLLAQQLVEHPRVERRIRRAEHQGAARAEGAQQVAGGGIERKARHLQVAGDRPPIPPGVGEAGIDRRAVADHHALGLPSGTRGVDHPGGAIEPSQSTSGVRQVGRVRRGRCAGRVHQQDALAPRQTAAQPGGGQHQLDPGVGELEGEARRRMRGVERQVGGARLEHADDADDALERRLEQDRHPALLPHPERAQAATQARGAAVELAAR